MISQAANSTSDQAFFLRGEISCLKLSKLNICIPAVAEKVANLPHFYYVGSNDEAGFNRPHIILLETL
jgi:hypothetical protein